MEDSHAAKQEKEVPGPTTILSYGYNYVQIYIIYLIEISSIIKNKNKIYTNKRGRSKMEGQKSSFIATKKLQDFLNVPLSGEETSIKFYLMKNSKPVDCSISIINYGKHYEVTARADFETDPLFLLNNVNVTEESWVLFKHIRIQLRQLINFSDIGPMVSRYFGTLSIKLVNRFLDEFIYKSHISYSTGSSDMFKDCYEEYVAQFGSSIHSRAIEILDNIKNEYNITADGDESITFSQQDAIQILVLDKVKFITDLIYQDNQAISSFNIMTIADAYTLVYLFPVSHYDNYTIRNLDDLKIAIRDCSVRAITVSNRSEVGKIIDRDDHNPVNCSAISKIFFCKLQNKEINIYISFKNSDIVLKLISSEDMYPSMINIISQNVFNGISENVNRSPKKGIKNLWGLLGA